MKGFKFCLTVLVLFVLTSSLAYGQADRTWVSGVGNDADPCSRTAPCKTWAGAYAKTAAGGEIDALDPGGFGALTIGHSLTIDGGGGQVASTLVSGSNGIVVAAGSTDVVIIRNIRLNGLLNTGIPGFNGIRFISGKFLSIENCDIFGFNTNGIDLEPAQANNSFVQVKNSTSTNNAGKGLFAAGTGGGTIKVSVDNSYFGGNAHGVWADENSQVTVSRSVADGNSGVGFIAQGNGGGATMNVTASFTTSNGVGIQAGGGASASTLSSNGTFIAGNTAGIVTGANGATHSFGSGTNPITDLPNTFSGTANPIQ